MVDCDNGEIPAEGGCQSADLTWSGAFGESGTYHVLVTNYNTDPTSALLKITGAGVSLGPQAIPSRNTNVSLATTTTTVNLNDPARATAINNQSQTIPAGSARWYRFDYGVSDTGDRPVRTITLVNGNNSGVRFEVWTPDNLTDWWDKQPIRRGTSHVVSCDTGDTSEQGGCQSNDLTWTGAFDASGTYYVRVVNDNTHATAFELTIQ